MTEGPRFSFLVPDFLQEGRLRFAEWLNVILNDQTIREDLKDNDFFKQILKHAREFGISTEDVAENAGGSRTTARNWFARPPVSFKVRQDAVTFIMNRLVHVANEKSTQEPKRKD